MKYRTFLPSALLPMVLLMQPATSHHSVFAEFDVMKSGTIEGVITEVWFKMPHVRYFVVVTDELGEEVTWNIHGHQPGILMRNGWFEDSVKVGDRVTVTGDPTRNGSPKLFIRSLSMADGIVLHNRDPKVDAPR